MLLCMRPWTWLLASCLLAGAWLGGCDGNSELSVGLQTDFVAGVEFDSVRIDLDGVEATRRDVTVSDSFARPRTLLERTGVANGRRSIRLSLLRDGEVVARRTREIPFRDRYLTTIVITRSCREVRCPGPGDDAAETECAGGVCLAPDCDTEGGPACPDPQCSPTMPCAAASSTCAESMCVEGVCLELPRADACEDDEVCVPGSGCILRPGGEMPDAGLPPSDAFAAACDDDMDCPEGPCEDARCLDGICSVSSTCAVGESCCAGSVCAVDCSSATCAGQPAGTLCRAAADLCDAEERCDGTSPTCPPDGVAGAGVECRAAVDACDVAEQCNGSVSVCPSDGFAGVGTMCTGGVCNGLGACGPCSEGAPCATGNVCERGELRCGGGSPSCTAVGPADGATPCRDAAGPCDAAETCSGSTSCPADGFASGMICHPSAGACDVAEACDGSSAACPGDALISGMICRLASGVCGRDSTCDGVSPSCPAESFRSSGGCRASAGTCDSAESCDGSSADCPSDLRTTGGTTCRFAVGACDVNESCDGVSVSCPPDGYAPMGMMCSGGTCDGAGNCATGCGVVPNMYSAPIAFGVGVFDCGHAIFTRFGGTTVEIVDLATAVRTPFTVGTSPLNLTLDTTRSRAFVALGDARVAVVQLPSGIVTHLPAPTGLRWAAQNPARPADLWLLSTSGVSSIDVNTGTSRFGAALPFVDPNGIAFDDATGQVYVSDRSSNQLARLDPMSGAPIGAIISPCGSPQGLAFARVARRLYLACESGSVVVFAPDLTVLDTRPAPGAFGLALSDDESMLAIASGGAGTTVVRVSDWLGRGTFPGVQARRVGFANSDGFVVVADEGRGLDVFALP